MVGVGVADGALVGVAVGAPVGVGVGATVGVGVGVGATVGVGVGVGATVGVGVGVGRMVGAGVGLGVGVGARVGVGATVAVMTSSGGWLDSRLARLRFVAFVVRSATLTCPLPCTSGVTSTDVHVPAVTGPEAPVFVAADTGAFEYVTCFSDHVSSVTANTPYPIDWPLFANSRSVAVPGVVVRPVTSNRTYDEVIGAPSTRTVMRVP
jgi:hypothetical protein